MMGYTKLFSEIVMSTVWREPDHVRILWITMLALKDRWHVVNASIPGLADAAKLSIKDCENALKVLSSPDKYSRNTDHEGRRIEPCEGGWIILNGEKYRNKMSLDERREYQRIKQREYREREKAVKSCQQNSQRFTHTEADTDTEHKEDIHKDVFVLPEWVNKDLWKEWMSVRLRKKAVNTDRAKRALITSLTEVKNSGVDPNFAIEKAIEKSWKSVELSWLTKPENRDAKPSRLQRSLAALNSGN